MNKKENVGSLFSADGKLLMNDAEKAEVCCVFSFSTTTTEN